MDCVLSEIRGCYLLYLCFGLHYQLSTKFLKYALKTRHGTVYCVLSTSYTVSFFIC